MFNICLWKLTPTRLLCLCVCVCACVCVFDGSPVTGDRIMTAMAFDGRGNYLAVGDACGQVSVFSADLIQASETHIPHVQIFF